MEFIYQLVDIYGAELPANFMLPGKQALFRLIEDISLNSNFFSGEYYNQFKRQFKVIKSASGFRNQKSVIA